MKRRPEILERALVRDIRAGMSGKDLMAKHHLTPELLRSKCMDLIEARLISPEQIPAEARFEALGVKGTATLSPVIPLRSWGLPCPAEIPDEQPGSSGASMFRVNAQHTGVRFTKEGQRIKGLQWVIGDLSSGYEPCITRKGIYVSAADGLHALDARSGAHLWRFVPRRKPRGTPAFSEGTVYFGSEDGTLHALDVEAGTELWRFTTGTEESASPTLTDDLVLCTNEDGYLIAIDRESGAFRRQFKAQRFIAHPPAVAGGVVYFSDMDNVVYAVDGRTGKPHWLTSTGGGVLTAPVISGGTIYFGCTDRHLYALDARSGYDLWSFEADMAVVWSPCVAEQTVYFGTLGGYLYAIDSRTGIEKWRVNLRKEVRGAPSVVDGVLYVGASNRLLSSPDNKLFALDPASGRTLWEHSTRGALCTSPVVNNGLVYFSTFQEGFAALGCGGPVEGGDAVKVISIRPSEPEWFRYLIGSAIVSLCAFLWGSAMMWGSAEADPEHLPQRVSLFHNWMLAVLCFLGAGYASLPLYRRFAGKPRSLIGWGLVTLGLAPLLTGVGLLAKTATDAVSGLIPGWLRRLACGSCAWPRR